ncbi:hypothetical protein NIES4103_11960 [Nostoc sp. NIES-4103]|nr:hypothetical protein NIES4103_11960 [Nostoc sp. NIES-4103]
MKAAIATYIYSWLSAVQVEINYQTKENLTKEIFAKKQGVKTTDSRNKMRLAYVTKSNYFISICV